VYGPVTPLKGGALHKPQAVSYEGRRYPAGARSLLENNVIPYFKRMGLSVGTVRFYGDSATLDKVAHIADLLNAHGITYIQIQRSEGSMHGYLERLHDTLRKEFFDIAYKHRKFRSLETLSDELRS
jgi:hypothetical protein